MSAFRHFLNRIKIRLRGRYQIVGWTMTPEEVISYFKDQKMIVLTFFGYSGYQYDEEQEAIRIAREVLSGHSPQSTLVNIGVTSEGAGIFYPVAKSMGFRTTGIVSTRVLNHPQRVSTSVDSICIVVDTQWGGNLPDSNELSPTSQAMVACSDILVAIGGGKISRDELIVAKRLGKPIQYFPAAMDRAWAIARAKSKGIPPPESFDGEVHEWLDDEMDSKTTPAATDRSSNFPHSAA